MQNLSDPSALGAGIAVAFVATIYGLFAANLLLLPMSSRIKVNFAKVFIVFSISITRGIKIYITINVTSGNVTSCFNIKHNLIIELF